MEEEKKVITPPWGLRIHLFLLFAYTIFRVSYLMRQISIFRNDALEGDLSLAFKLIYWGLDFLFYPYIFVAICRALKHNSDAIAMLRFSVVYLLCQTFVLSMNNYYMWQFLVYLPIIGWLILFLVYLARSKKLKAFISKRTFGKYGLFGTAIFVGCVALFTTEVWHNHNMDRDSRCIKRGMVSLTAEERENGYFVFVPKTTWKQDTILSNEDKSLIYIYDDTLSHDRMLINGMVETVDNRVDYYQMVTYFSRRMFKDLKSVNELHNAEERLLQGVLYSNAYKVVTAKDTTIWTIGMYVDSNSHKLCVISYDGDGDRSTELSNFCKHVDFNLKQRLAEQQGVD